MRTSFASRSPRPQRAQTGRGLSESSHHLFKGTRKWKRIRTEPDPAQLSFSSSGQTPRTEDSMHTGPTAHLLPETGGPGPPSTNSGENLFGYSAILKKTNKNKLEHKCVICKNDRLKAPKVRFYHWTLLMNLRLSRSLVCWHCSRDHYFSNIQFENWIWYLCEYCIKIYFNSVKLSQTELKLY